MGKPFSLDFKKRVVAPVRSGGLSCNQADKRFGLAINTAIGCSVAAGTMGGHRPRAISGEHRLWMLERIKDQGGELSGSNIKISSILSVHGTSVRKVKGGETTNDLYAFLTTEPNGEVGAIHPKAMR